jgi:hypothetical protein
MENSMEPKIAACVPSRANGATGRFKKGDPKPQGSGRKPGTPNCMTTTIKEAVVAAANFVGEKRLNVETDQYEPGDGGLIGFMIHLALHNESAFCMLLGRALPLHVKAEVKKTYLTEEEVRAMCAEYGIPFESMIDLSIPASEVPPDVAREMGLHQ